MNENQLAYDPAKHICRFIFEQYCQYHLLPYRLRIEGNLRDEVISIAVLDEGGDITQCFLYSVRECIDELLPLLLWEKYEKYRDVSGWDLHNNGGYRDGWGYKFACISEAGPTMIQANLDVTFSKKYAPPYEILIKWIIDNYSARKEFKKMDIIW